MTAQTPPSVDPTTLGMLAALLEERGIFVPHPLAVRLFAASRAYAGDAEARMEFGEQYLGYLASFVVQGDPLPIGQHDADRVGQVMTSGDWWTADLLRLIAKSDIPHRERLRLAFPSHVEAYEHWHAGGEQACPECGGSGTITERGYGTGSCESCGGSGRMGPDVRNGQVLPRSL